MAYSYSAPLYVDMTQKVKRQRHDPMGGDADWEEEPGQADGGVEQDKVWIGKVRNIIPLYLCDL